jgi:glycosyltransferase involved in cell wall biosynthesis
VVRNDRNLGQSANTNKAVRLSHGEYVMVLHADDWLLPHCVETLLSLLLRFPEAGLAAGEHRYKIGNDDDLKAPCPYYGMDCVYEGKYTTLGVHFCRMMFRRSVWDSVGGVDERYLFAQDIQMAVKLSALAKGHEMTVYTREPVGVYRMHGTSTTSGNMYKLTFALENALLIEDLTEKYRVRYSLPDNAEPPFKRQLVKLFIRTAHNYILAGKPGLARDTLTAMSAVSPELRNGEEYKKLRFLTEFPEAYRLLYGEAYRPRTGSYPMPEGARVI